MHERHRPEAGAGRGVGTVLADRRFHRAQEHTQQTADDLRLVAHMPADPLRDRQHPLAELDPGQNLIDHMGRGPDHAPRRAGRAEIPTLAGESDQEIVAAVRAIDPGESVSQDAAFQIVAVGGFDMERDRSLEITIRIDPAQIGFQIVSDSLVQQAVGRTTRTVDARR